MKVAVIGSGPAGLMAAAIASAKGAEVHVFERRAALGRKLLIAGSSGLNISHHLPRSEFLKHYKGFDSAFWDQLLAEYSVDDWVSFIETELKLETFIGTSDRYFVREMKASNLLKRWQELLLAQKVIFHPGHELFNFSRSDAGVDLQFSLLKHPDTLETHHFDRAGFFFGGGSWEDVPPTWPGLLARKGLEVLPLTARNVGYEVEWPKDFVREAQGLPLKKINFMTAKGSKLGELMVTEYGLEGTPIYFHGQVGTVFIDLKPDFTHAQIREKLLEVRENLSPLRRVKKRLALGPAALALIFHLAPAEVKADLDLLIAFIKAVPVELLRPRPLLEAISSAGGLSLDEVTSNLELKNFPGIYCGGEMLDWHSPTGGFLIQACVSQGARIGRELSRI